MKKNVTALSATLILLCLAPGYARGEADFPVVTSVEANYAGLGVGVLPDYLGSNEYTFGLLPVFRYEFGEGRNFELKGNYASANLLTNDNFHFGPAVRYRFKRDSDVDDEVVKRMKKVDGSLEVGATLEGEWVLNNDPRNRFSIGMDALWDTSAVSNGMNGMLYARYWQPATDLIDIGISANLMYADDDFNNMYFGMDAADSAATGLPIYTAGEGLTSFSIQPMMSYRLNESWLVGAGVRFTRLTGDAADSPIVETRGSENQVIGGIGLVYTWGGKVITR